MTIKIQGSELGIANCDFVAQGEIAGDVVSQMVEHLRSEHELDMPEVEVIMGWQGNKTSPLMIEEEVILIIERLREVLNLSGSDEPPGTRPAIGRTPSA